MFSPTRLTTARKRRRLTKKDLAVAVGVTAHSILRYESGENVPKDDVVSRLVQALDFPREFFFEPDVDGPSEGAASFRSMSSISPKDVDAALAAGTLSFIFADWMEERFDLPSPDLLDLSGDTPETAARSLREKWGLGERPIENMVRLLEAKGVRLFSMAENTMAVDAFSVWRGDTPYVFLNMMKTAERSRLDAAHELGHLVMHRHGGPAGRAAEDEANAFAESLLMPSADVIAALPRVHTLNQIIEAKKRWSVSAMALIHRLNKLGIMSDWQYRMFCIDATGKGYRRAEPSGIPRERSIVWQKVLRALWNERVTKTEIAAAIHFPVEEVENLLFGLVGGGASEPSAIGRPSLRLV